jgi:two-component system, chemotaxis family, protein-glutamate methylesterase/glutaminase
MGHRDIIVIGASAGGIEALQDLVRVLPDKLRASVFVTVHFPEHGTSVLPRILSRAGPLAAVHVVDGESIVHGRIYVAPPDFHLVIERDCLRLVRGPKENGNRPAIDPMFRSAAVAFGPRVIGVVLSGNLDDGTSGLAAIKRSGGVAVVQDPDDALFPSMPESAIEHVQVDHVVPIRSLGKMLADLVAETLDDAAAPALAPDDLMEKKYSVVDLDTVEDENHRPGRPSSFGCPDCGGVLWEVSEGNFVRYRCRVGHAWTSDALLARQSDSFDDAMWTALRALEESASLSRQIAARHRARGADRLAGRFESQAESTEMRARVIRDSLLQHHGIQVKPDVGATSSEAE